MIVTSNIIEVTQLLTKMQRRFYSETPRFIPRHALPSFNIPKSDFKGHQMKALRKFRKLAPELNLLIELRDIRAPLSTRNVVFDSVLKENKFLKKLVIYTKKDLTTGSSGKDYFSKLSQWHAELNEKFIIVDGRSKTDAMTLLKILQWESFKNAENGMRQPMGYRAFIAGMPNVGKSTLVNTLRMVSHPNKEGTKFKKVAKTGSEAGVTRSTSEIIKLTQQTERIDSIYLIDSPGIGVPGRLSSQNRMLSLALTGSVKISLINPVIQADYLLYLMNLQIPKKNLEWYPGFSTNPTNDIYEVLNRLTKNSSDYNEDAVALNWVNKWRENSHNLLFDVEVLLNPEDFSYMKFVSDQLEDLGDLMS
ncbi:Mitochondrial GTPase 1 [Nakaseomyces bracarensis]|uniref:Mitochondrial GTPase 1 n=1 Tax=Nakaseomyces bracarensis TaxID=273131 RepID=A0ABR4NXW4_9SACH